MPTLGTQRTLDRVSVKRADEAWLSEQLSASAARFMVLTDLKPVITSSADRSQATIRWFSRAELASLGLPTADALFLGLTGEGHGRFAITITEHRARAVQGGMEKLRPAVDLRSLAMQGIMTPDELAIAGEARSLAGWHDLSRCCGRCGGTTVVKDGGWRRRCWACGQNWFPRTDPVVIMLIAHGDNCLLAHEHRYADKFYSTLAGFVEPGEDIEHAVQRELLEETGVKVGDVRYLASQPWPFPHSLMIGCIGTAQSTELAIDRNEIAEARWFTRAEVKSMLEGQHPEGLSVPGRHAIANRLIRHFVGET